MRKTKWLIGLLYLLSFFFTLAFYSTLPDTMPIHWNIEGQPDRYAPKMASVSLGLITPLIIYLLMNLVPYLDPKKKENYQNFIGPYALISTAIVVFLLGLHWLTILVGLGYELDISRLVPAGLGLLFIVLGNHLTQIRHNYFIGIRTPWTLANEEIWRRTHRLAAPLWVLGGIVCFISAFLGATIKAWLFLGVLIIMTMVPLLYSYQLFRKS